MTPTGMVFDIQKFCVNDGPGVRTTVFLKGCQMRCLWCHNPESMRPQKQLSFSADKCIQCQACAQVCAHHQFINGEHRIDLQACDGCGKCVAVCPTQALKVYGDVFTVGQILSEVLKDKIYFDKSGGGITLSGGEALFQFAFTLELARRSKQAGLHVCLETHGASKASHYITIAPFVDLFLLDYKATDEAQHLALTGMRRRQIDSNMALLEQLGAQVILRCPLVPGYNVSAQHLAAIGQQAQRYRNIQRIEILPYHNFGARKAREIGKFYQVSSDMPDEQQIEQWLAEIRQHSPVEVSRG